MNTYDGIIEKINKWTKDGYQIYADYRDELSDDQICRILKAKNPKDIFYDLINELYEDYICQTYNELWEDFLNENSLSENEEEIIAEKEDELKQYFMDTLNIEYPYDHYLGQTINCDIIVNNKDKGTEYCRHDCYPNWYANGNIHSNLSRESGMMLIANLQGYSNKQFKKIYRQYALSRMYDKQAKQKQLEEKYPFITSCYKEIWECPNAQTCFVICINIDLETLLGWHENPTDIHIPKNTCCIGLYNYWSGGGSLLEIELEKDICIPKENIDQLLPDEAWNTSQNRGIYYGYSISNCYGMCEDQWLPLSKL